MNIAQMTKIQPQNKTLFTNKLCSSKIQYFSLRKLKCKKVLGDWKKNLKI